MIETTRFPLLRRFWHNKPIRWSLLGILLPVSGAMTAYAVTEPVPEYQGFKVERVSEELPAVYIETGNFQSSYWAQEVVQQGDSLADVLTRMGVPQTDIKQIMAKNSAERDMQHLRANQSVNIRIDASGQVTDVQFFTDEELERNLVALEKVKGKWQASTSEVDMKTMPTLRSVVVRTSARGAMAQAEIPVEIRESLSEIFSDVLSLEDLKEGDVIRLLYDSMYFRGQQMGTGNILAAEIVKGGKSYQAYYYSQGKGDEESGSYYDQSGKSLQQKAGFNIEPVVYTRISSPFGYRVHPVLHTVRMHTGIDYAAPSGTPIKATADGVITFKGWKGGYGNTVMIRHSNGVETLYGHMSAFTPVQGVVRAGEVIGFVGTTGRSTGPHLHYEARVNSQPVNPTTVALPTPKLTPTNMAAFRQQQKSANTILASIRGLPVSVAQLD
ncbi:M23 family metallopeptidase [Neisseria mucosa]|uniref:M23 family metallopeptidase n=2 Tax=Neisseria TaxID=482 RepID=A0AAW6Z779_NEIMU|nr:M23 family metallopeptidase [Neisseria mucosa]ARC50660.1 peptidase M23 [Neisseria mucosa]AVR80110.1 peptidase M23 [Neisseria mucosa]MDK6727219.1 M23 family metallopeptidase [Neisseria mucosa]MDK6870063.1 M23 family metallopeptidase [Neisseria mucosa]MDK8109710.1 M23 family metallopeptidase [Neisseria mucosa]